MSTTDWQPIETAPLDGTRVRLGHRDDASSMKVDGMCKTFGTFEDGKWVLSSFFIVPGGQHGLLSNAPTHWRPYS